MVSVGSPFREGKGCLLVDLRLQPGASRAKVDGPARLDDGAMVLKLRVTEPPEDGKANAALVRLLAKSWGLPKSRSEEHTSELQSLMRISYAVFCLKKNKEQTHEHEKSILMYI